MGWWRRVVVSPVRSAWVAFSARFKGRKTGRGIMELHNDVLTCGYEDVQVMWEMLRRSEMEFSPARKRKRTTWRTLLFADGRRKDCGAMCDF